MEATFPPSIKDPQTEDSEAVSSSRDEMAQTNSEQADRNGGLVDDSSEQRSTKIPPTGDTSVAPRQALRKEEIREHQEAGNEESAAIPVSLSDQDMAVFGKLNTLLADAFARTIEAAITEGVDSLPLLDGDCYREKSLPASPDEKEAAQTNQKSPKQRLWERLRYKFIRNVDVLEAYCARHVLTLRKHPPARRKRIVKVMRGGFEALPPLAMKDGHKKAADEDKAKSSFKYPTRSELPSEQEQNDLIEELSRLKADLEAAREKRNALLASLESANRAEQAVQDVWATVEANIPSLDEGAIKSQVLEKVEKGNTISLLAEEAKALVGNLDRINRDRNQKQNSKNEEEGYDFVQRDDPLFKASNRVGHKRHKPLSLEEAYWNDRQQLGLLTDSTNTDDRNSVSSMAAFRSMVIAPPSPLPAATPRTPKN